MRSFCPEFGLDNAIRETPAEEMKIRSLHFVLLSKEEVVITQYTQIFDRALTLCFSGTERSEQLMSEASIN